jgi:hypothetical protein
MYEEKERISTKSGFYYFPPQKLVNKNRNKFLNEDSLRLRMNIDSGIALQGKEAML